MSAEQEVTHRYSIMIKRNAQDKWATFGWSEQNGGGWVECQLEQARKWPWSRKTP
jgi:hypothetical protein